MNRIYLDNAATTLKKPPGVVEDITEFLTGIGACAGRGAYEEAQHTSRLLTRCRERFNRLINGQSASHCIFAFNGSDANNIAIKGVLRPGDHVVSTRIDHNSVLRPLHALRDRLGIEVTFVPVDPSTGVVEPDAMAKAITPKTRLVAMTHCSNVLGSLQPISEIGRICRDRGVLFMVDAAQSAGHVPIDVQADRVDLLTCPGHKGLLGPAGTGFCYIRPGIEGQVQTWREGGTGSSSELPYQPQTLPDKYEPGSHNAVGVVGLSAALAWILEQGVETLFAHDRELCRLFIDELAGLPGLTLYGPRMNVPRVGVFTLRLAGYEPQELSSVLESHFGVLTRSGVHCAPFTHQAMGTLETGGATRFSFSALTTRDDVLAATNAIRELAMAAAAVGQ